MQKLVKITHIGATKTGISQKTGNEWSLTDIDVTWTVEQPGRDSYTQSCCGMVNGKVNTEVLNQYYAMGKEILITMYVGVRVWNDRHFTNVDIYLPKELMLE